MEFSNKSRTKLIKQRFNLFVVACIAVALYFVWKDEMRVVLFIGIGLVVVVGFVLFLNYNYVSFSSNYEKIVIRYYPVISLMGREYNTIDFKQELLHSYELNRNFLFSDLTVTVKTKRGVAEYPQVSLSAFKKEEIEMIRQELERISGSSKNQTHDFSKIENL